MSKLALRRETLIHDLATARADLADTIPSSKYRVWRSEVILDNYDFLNQVAPRWDAVQPEVATPTPVRRLTGLLRLLSFY